MPRKSSLLHEQIRRLEALVKADRAERRAADAPVRVARRKLSERLQTAVKSVDIRPECYSCGREISARAQQTVILRWR